MESLIEVASEIGIKLGVLNNYLFDFLKQAKWPPQSLHRMSKRRLDRIYGYTVKAIDNLEKFRRYIAYAKAENEINRIERSK